MRLYIEPMFAYNEFEQELQYIGLSTLLQDNEGTILYENHLDFPAKFGVDTTYLGWIKKYGKVVGSNESETKVKEELDRVNEMIDENTLILTWNNIYKELGYLKSNRRVVVMQAVGEGKSLMEKYKEVTNEPLNDTSTKARLYATKIVYEQPSETPLTEDNEKDLTVEVSEDINKVDGE